MVVINQLSIIRKVGLKKLMISTNLTTRSTFQLMTDRTRVAMKVTGNPTAGLAVELTSHN